MEEIRFRVTVVTDKTWVEITDAIIDAVLEIEKGGTVEIQMM